MSQRARSSPAPPARSWKGRRQVILILFILAGVALVFRGRGILAGWTRHVAQNHLNDGAVTQAQQWLTWSVWFDPQDGTTELMRAACFRHLTQEEHWSEALQSAERKGAPNELVEREIERSLIRTGRLREGSEQQQLRASIDAGESPHEIVTAFVYGYLRRKDPKRAKLWIDLFAAEYPDEVQVTFLRGIYQRSQGEHARAKTEFETALAMRPGHELARAALAEMAEEQDLLDQALEQYVQMATHAPACEVAHVGMARVLRKLGKVDRAQATLQPLASRPSPSSDVLLEMGNIVLEQGHYASAKRWFERVNAAEAKMPEAMAAALTPNADASLTLLADRLFTEAEAEDYRFKRAEFLRARLAIDADDTEALRELQQLYSRPDASTDKSNATRTARPLPSGAEDTAEMASELYALHCSACHGQNGDGNGRAGRHLFPRPRNLRTRAVCKLVSTVNGVPTLEDIETVIRRGMPGTSMQSFEFLSALEQRLLAQEVLRLNRDGIRDQIINELSNYEDEIDSDEVHQLTELWSTPGEVVRAPSIGHADAQAVARGKNAYIQLGCHNCHGNDGVGARDMALFDAQGIPTRRATWPSSHSRAARNRSQCTCAFASACRVPSTLPAQVSPTPK